MKRITKHVSYANVAATLAVVLAMSGGAIAATGGFTNGGAFRACVNQEGGLKLLKSGKKCKKVNRLSPGTKLARKALPASRVRPDRLAPQALPVPQVRPP